MPEELLIILVVLGIAVWLLYAAAKAVAEAIDTTQKGSAGSIARAKADRFRKRKDCLRAFVRIVLPADLERTTRKIAQVEAAFAARRKSSKWVAHRPTWKKVPFKALAAPMLNTQSAEMNVGNLAAILRPNAEPWHEKESRMLGRNCSYPSMLPLSSPRVELESFTLPEIPMESAIFEASSAAIREKDLDRFFDGEREAVEQYNEKRRLLLSRYEKLSNSVAEWNERERREWS